MRKTIIGLMMLGISLVIIFYFISRDGEFTKWSHPTLGIEHFEEGMAYYFGYRFQWEGIGNPMIEKIEFMKNDGSIVAKDDNEFRVEPFIGIGGIGVIDEDYGMKEGLLDALKPVDGVKVDDEFHLVLRVELIDPQPSSDIESLRIMYKKLGVTQFQSIPFADGVITDE